jgi:transcriptional regulator with XRE-family HTH domain
MPKPSTKTAAKEAEKMSIKRAEPRGSYKLASASMSEPVPELVSGKGRSEILTMQYNDPWKTRLVEAIRKSGTTPTRVGTAAGLSQSTVRQTLLGRDSPRVTTLIALCRTLGVTLDWIMLGVEKGEDIRVVPGQGVMVPVIELEQVRAFSINQQGVTPMRMEAAATADVQTGRFRCTHNDTSMSGLVDAGSTMDCSLTVEAETEDVVIAWIAKTNKVVVRTFLPKYKGSVMVGAQLRPTSQSWPTIHMDLEGGDKVLAVVVEVVKKMRRNKFDKKS